MNNLKDDIVTPCIKFWCFKCGAKEWVVSEDEAQAHIDTCKEKTK